MRNLDDKLLGNEIQVIDLCINKHRYRNTPRYSYSFIWRLGSRSLRSQPMTILNTISLFLSL